MVFTLFVLLKSGDIEHLINDHESDRDRLLIFKKGNVIIAFFKNENLLLSVYAELGALIELELSCFFPSGERRARKLTSCVGLFKSFLTTNTEEVETVIGDKSLSHLLIEKTRFNFNAKEFEIFVFGKRAETICEETTTTTTTEESEESYDTSLLAKLTELETQLSLMKERVSKFENQVNQIPSIQLKVDQMVTFLKKYDSKSFAWEVEKYEKLTPSELDEGQWDSLGRYFSLSQRKNNGITSLSKALEKFNLDPFRSFSLSSISTYRHNKRVMQLFEEKMTKYSNKD